MFSPTPHVKRSSDTFSSSRRLADLTHLDSGPVVRRPGAAKPKSKLRVSFNPGDADLDDSSNIPSESDIPPSKPTSRLGPSARLQDRLRQASLRETDDDERPSYSKSHLDELRNSTPSTPTNLARATPPDEDEQAILDIESKFGPLKPSAFSTATNAIHVPSSSEIAEKKARRARLALNPNAEQDLSQPQGQQTDDFISLDAYDSDGEFKPQRLQVSTFLQPSSSTKDTRLEREDEDIAEGFEHFIEDDPGAIKGRYSTNALQLDRKSRKAHAAREREKMKGMIDHAEASHSDDTNSNINSSDDSASEFSESDHERRQAYESAQTHRGLDGLSSAHSAHRVKEHRPTQPRETTPIPKLSVGLGRLREQVARIQEEKARIERRLQDVRREKSEVKDRQRVVQEGLEGLGRELERLSGSGSGELVGVVGSNGQVLGPGMDREWERERGLESFGVRRDEEQQGGDDNEDDGNGDEIEDS